MAAGDPVALILPLTPLAVAAYFGCVISGCPVVSIADSFSAGEIQSRLRIAGAKMIITQDVVVRGGKALPLYSRVVISGSGTGSTPPVIVIPGTADLKPYLVAPWTGVARTPTSGATTTAPTVAVVASSHAMSAGPTTLRGCDQAWSSFMGWASPFKSLRTAKLSAFSTPECLHVATPHEATNILFSSGTTVSTTFP